jgi:peroxiredoxin
MKKFFPLIMFTTLITASGTIMAETAGEQLERELAAMATASAAKGGDNQKVMQSAIDAIKDLPKKSPKAGDKLPEFALPAANGKTVKSNELSGQGKYLIVTFYRGGWCPYCNLQLRAFQKVLPEIRARGGELIAVSPETPDNTLSTAEKNELKFVVLSDKDNAYARKIGLVFELPKDLQAVYQKFGIDLAKQNGLGKWELPLAATFVVKPDGEIVYAFVDADYKKRASIDQVLAALPGKASSN